MSDLQDVKCNDGSEALPIEYMAGNPRLTVFWPDEDMRDDFKRLVLDARTSQSARVVELVAEDLAYWRKFGKPREIGRFEFKEDHQTGQP